MVHPNFLVYDAMVLWAHTESSANPLQLALRLIVNTH